MTGYSKRASLCFNAAEESIKCNDSDLIAVAAHIIVEGIRYLLCSELYGNCFLPLFGNDIKSLFNTYEAQHQGDDTMMFLLKPHLTLLSTYESYNIEVNYDVRTLRKLISIGRTIVCDTPIQYVPTQPLAISYC